MRPPKGDDWTFEPKWDGFRFQVIKDGSDVRFYSRHGAEYTDRLPGMAEAIAKLPTWSAILDGELVLIDPRGTAHFYQLMSQMRTSSPDESQLMFLAFDCCFRMALICEACRCPSASATCTGFASNPGCRS
jgi:bifunctional non-homologous end joining protein LigD